MASHQYERNEGFLSNFELGGVLLDGYDAAREADPRLDEVEISPITDPEQISLGLAVAKWAVSVESGMHKIRLRLDNPMTAFDLCRQHVQRDPTTYHVIGERLGVAFNRLTPQLLSVFVELHELGHISQYFDHEENPEALASAIREERSMLPYVYAPPSYIADKKSPVRRNIEAHWGSIRSRLGVSTVEQLVEIQAIAYRNMPTEANADHFAIEVLSDNPTFMDMLLAGDW
jgi:hypothetical protein